MLLFELIGVTSLELVEFVDDLERRTEFDLHRVHEMIVADETQRRAVDVLRLELIRHRHARHTTNESKDLVAIPLAWITAREVTTTTDTHKAAIHAHTHG